MPDSPVNLTPGMGETIIPPAPEEALIRLEQALAEPVERRRDAVAGVVATFPRFLDGWARLGELARDDVEAYACYRVGYHRGLDALRAAGWRGSGYVRWRNEGNRGFLRCVEGLRREAAALGEVDEEERCSVFVRQLDPTWNGLEDQGR